MVLFFAVLMAAIALGRFLARDVDPTVSPPPDRSAVRAGIQLLFTDVRASIVTVDGVVVGYAPGALPPGSPVTLSVETPASAPLADVVLTTLERWAFEGRVVDLELRSLPPGVIARLSDGRSTVSLEVAAARVG